MSEETPEYSELLLGKNKKLYEGQNPNFRRFEGLKRLVIVLKRDKIQIQTSEPKDNNITNEHVILYKNHQVECFDAVINYYENLIKQVKEKIKNNDKNV